MLSTHQFKELGTLQLSNSYSLVKKKKTHPVRDQSTVFKIKVFHATKLKKINPCKILFICLPLFFQLSFWCNICGKWGRIIGLRNVTNI